MIHEEFMSPALYAAAVYLIPSNGWGVPLGKQLGAG